MYVYICIYIMICMYVYIYLYVLSSSFSSTFVNATVSCIVNITGDLSDLQIPPQSYSVKIETGIDNREIDTYNNNKNNINNKVIMVMIMMIKIIMIIIIIIIIKIIIIILITVLLPKTKNLSDERNYRPSTCLNTLRCLVAKYMRERIAVNEIWDEGALGALEGLLGTVNQLIINRCMMEESKQHRRKLAVAR